MRVSPSQHLAMRDSMFAFVHHVHYLVRDLDAIVDFMSANFEMSPITDEVGSSDHELRESIREARFKVGETIIEFTESLDPESKYGKRLAEHGPHVMHVAWGVRSLDQASARLTANGTRHKVKTGPRGYRTINVDLAEALGTHFQLAEEASQAP